jgi:hypothetical protein
MFKENEAAEPSIKEARTSFIFYLVFLNGFKRGSEGKDSSNRYNGRQRRGPGTSDPVLMLVV